MSITNLKPFNFGKFLRMLLGSIGLGTLWDSNKFKGIFHVVPVQSCFQSDMQLVDLQLNHGRLRITLATSIGTGKSSNSFRKSPFVFKHREVTLETDRMSHLDNGQQNE